MNRTLPWRSSGLGLALAAPADGDAEPAADALGGATLGEAAAPHAATIAPTTLGARPRARSRVTNVRRDILPATYASARCVVVRSRSVFMAGPLLLPRACRRPAASRPDHTAR